MEGEENIMKGVGGPLLCIGDLLSDLEETHPLEDLSHPSKPSSSSSINDGFQPLDLAKLFQDNYSKLNEALSGTDHSWTSLTLKLCNAMETANKLVESTNGNVRSLSEKVEELEKVVKRGDSAVASAKAVHFSLNQTGGTSRARD